MEDSLIVAREIPHGYTWTLASRLGDMLSEAEALYGMRDHAFTILGIEFCGSGPRIWYPNSRDHIIIQLSHDALFSEVLACYQLAHECIHLLSPSGECNANVLEEGLAVVHSWNYVREHFQVNGKDMTFEKSYLEAGLLVQDFLARYDVKKLRSHYPRLWSITSQDLLRLYPDLTEKVSKELASRFKKPEVSGKED